MAAAFVKNVGSAVTTNDTSHQITVPAAGVALGNLLEVAICINGYDDISSMTDTQGNTYTAWALRDNGNYDVIIYRCIVSTALVSGNTITATTGMMHNSSMSVEEFSEVSSTEDTETSGAGSSSSPSSGSASMTNATNLVVGVVGGEVALAFSSEDSDTNGGDSWHSLTRVEVTNQVLNGHAYKFTTSATGQTYNPTMTGTGNWTAVICSLNYTAAATFIAKAVTVQTAVTRASVY